LGVSPSLSVGGRAIRHSLHSAIAPLRSNNTYYPLREKRATTKFVKEPYYFEENELKYILILNVEYVLIFILFN